MASSRHIEGAKAVGEAQGLERGLTQGLEQGLTQGLTQGILAVLSARGLEITAEQRARIATTVDPAVVSAWLAAAVSARSVTELLVE